jgi:hypothetical protein
MASGGSADLLQRTATAMYKRIAKQQMVHRSIPGRGRRTMMSCGSTRRQAARADEINGGSLRVDLDGVPQRRRRRFTAAKAAHCVRVFGGART